MNGIYDEARVKSLTANLNWLTTDLMLVAWAGSPSFVPTDKFVADIKARGAVVLGYSLAITEQMVSTDGTAQTNAVVIPTVPVGSPVTWFTMCTKNTPVDNSELILFVDQADGLPFEPNGLDMVVTPDWLQNRGWWRP